MAWSKDVLFFSVSFRLETCRHVWWANTHSCAWYDMQKTKALCHAQINQFNFYCWYNNVTHQEIYWRTKVQGNDDSIGIYLTNWNFQNYALTQPHSNGSSSKKNPWNFQLFWPFVSSWLNRKRQCGKCSPQVSFFFQLLLRSIHTEIVIIVCFEMVALFRLFRTFLFAATQTALQNVHVYK